MLPQLCENSLMSVSGQFSFPSRFNRSRNRRLNVKCCTTRNGQSFGKYAQSALTDGVNYIVFGQEKQERLRYEKINPDPYAKRTARRVAAAPAIQSNPVGLASRTPQAHARRPLEYSHLAIPRAHGANVCRRFYRAFCRNCPAPHLNLSPGQ